MQCPLRLFPCQAHALAKGGSKPGGPQSKNLIPVTQRSPEEAQAIRSKGGKARAKQRHEQALLSQIIRSVLAMGYRKGAVADPNDIYTLEEAKKKNVPIQTLIVMQEVEKYLATGNTESRDWLFKYAFGENAPLPDFPEGEAAEQKKDGISIHLIRGDKPLEQESEEDKATREAARKATAEALKAIGQAAEKAGTDQDAQ